MAPTSGWPDQAAERGPPSGARHLLPGGIDADEVIVELVDGLEPGQPVVVATDDRRVRDEVTRRGANVISVVQLLAVFGRLPRGSEKCRPGQRRSLIAWQSPDPGADDQIG